VTSPAHRRVGSVAALLLVGLLGVVAPAAVARPGHFVNKVDAPATPPMLRFGADLQLTAAPLLGNFEGDAEFWDLFYAAAAGIAPVMPTAPVDGWLTGVTVKGYAVSGDMPGPGGSEPFRVGVEQPLPGGQLQVVSTSNPPFQLSGTSGTYYYWIGPPYTGFPMPLKTGQVVSFDTRGGTWAVFGSEPGSASASTVGTGLEQNAGVIWTGTSHPGVELLMVATEQPKVPVTKLEAAKVAIGKALALEQEAEGASRRSAKSKLKSSISELQSAEGLLHQAGEANEGEVSHDTEASVEHYLREAAAEDKGASSAKTKNVRKAHIKAAIEAKRTALSDISRAKGLAKQVP
jgi:hypothetical protein